MHKIKFIVGLLAMIMIISGTALAAPSDDAMQAVEKLQHRWEVIKFETAKDQQETAYEALAKEAHNVSEQYAGQAEPLVWEAIILSTYAGAKGGLGALSLVKNARDLLLQAEKVDPTVLDGSVYASLGNLYYQVPGWPIGFGNDKKARNYLEKALQINPDGIEPNYFYGEFLYEEGPLRQGRELSDAGQRREIAAKIEDVKRQL
jgi:tetratricopeptide (TPR) repeat protein